VPTARSVPPERNPLIVLCIIAALLLMYATLWPFNPYPHNDVSWLPDANGIRFGGSGIVWSDAPLRPVSSAPSPDSCAIEIYLFPVTSDDAGNFLTFSSEDNLDAVFLRQWRESLLIYESKPQNAPGPKLVDFEIDDALRVKQLAVVTISSGEQGTTVYVDGKLASSDPHFRIHLTDLYRKVVLGTSPSNFEVWHGEIRGLAIYDREVSLAQAAAHHAEWTSSSSSPVVSAEDANHVLARYDFRERGGKIIRSEFGSPPPLTIPAHFSVPHKPLLASPIDEFQWDASWRRDVIENILGFMPFGFVLCGLFALSRPRGQAILMAMLVGGLLSLSVEFLQYYIPRRDSSLTDVISNTTGSLLGALIAHPELVRAALRLVFLIPPKRKSEAN
jgi:VanZ like protein/concanavalin A-like lectin/glucanase superfamily protein